MLEQLVKPEPTFGSDGRYITMASVMSENDSTLEKMHKAIEVVKTMPIKGVITGSCFLPHFDPDAWGTTPDIDVFCYGEDQLIKAITFAEYVLGMTPGKGSERTTAQEKWKIDRLYKTGLNHRIGITTYTFECCGIMVNFTLKERKIRGRWSVLFTAEDVLKSFDMSIVMQGYDIETGIFYDMRMGDPMTAIPNPLRDHDCTIWTVAKWVRQFDRVIKYHNRGYDTRPMAEFYLKMIDECIATGCLFDSEESQETFETFATEFTEKRDAIARWLEEHKED